MAYTDSQIAANPFLTQLNQALYNSAPGTQWTQQNRSDFADKATQMQQTFSSMFQNLVGRAPTQDELNQFQTQYLVPNAANLRTPGSAQNLDANTYLTNFISQNYQGAAKDYATQQLQQQQTQAQSLADQFRQMGTQSLNSTSDYLSNYAQQLFNRLQPQIITSMQNQGLLNTGGYNEAVAGAQKDLAGQAQGYLADANLQMQNQANQIAYGGAAAPYQYQQANIMNQVPYLQQQGATAMNQGYNNYQQYQQYMNQLGLQNNYFQNMQNSQPSFMRTLGQGFAGSFGNQSGQMAAQLPFAAMQSFGQGGTQAMGASMLA